jgi:hypothetical protein
VFLEQRQKFLLERHLPMMLLLAFEVLKLTYDMPAIQPSLRDLGHSKLSPALKRRAIFMMSSGQSPD